MDHKIATAGLWRKHSTVLDELHPRVQELVRAYYGLADDQPKTYSDVSVAFKLSADKVREHVGNAYLALHSINSAQSPLKLPMDQPIGWLDFRRDAQRLIAILENMNIKTVDQLLARTDRWLLAWIGFSWGYLDVVNEALEKNQLHLRPY